MTFGLRFRVMSVVVVVTFAAVAFVALQSRRTTLTEFGRRLEAERETRLDRFQADLEKHFETGGGLHDAQSLIDRVAATLGKEAILVAPDGSILAAGPVRANEAEITITPDHGLDWKRQRGRGGEAQFEQLRLIGLPHLRIQNKHGSLVGTLYVFPLPADGPESESFAASISRSLLYAGLVSVFAAACAAAVLSRRLVRPLETLTETVRHMERGDFSRRVAIESQDEVGVLASAFNSMADGLVRQEELRRNLVNDVAHELRTPLTNIRCHVESVLDGMQQPTPDLLASLHEETLLLANLVDDLQELSLAEAGQLRLSVQALDVGEVVRQAVAAVRGQVEKGEIDCLTDVPDDLPPAAADAVRLGQILRNLLANAIRHTPRGGRITVGARLIGNEIELFVADTGCGIPAEHLPFIFERFHRVDPSRNRSTGGAGIGLAVVKHLVAAHGGTARAESAVGRGTTMFVRFPAG